jgi:2-amino-4-hydroxy-6-hydroxymethyldihydropteridine diphosphokinase
MTGVTAFLGLGSNLGDRMANLRRAVDLLDATDGIDVVRTSAVYETDPVGPPQPDYLNAVVEARTTLTPRALLEAGLAVERALARVRDERWGPRTLDIDLLVYGDDQIDEPGLVVPHPRMRERAFVLVPLRELDPSAPEPPDARGVRRFGPQLTPHGDGVANPAGGQAT